MYKCTYVDLFLITKYNKYLAFYDSFVITDIYIEYHRKSTQIQYL